MDCVKRLCDGWVRGVFVGEDDGDRWLEEGKKLPEVYALDFTTDEERYLLEGGVGN